MFALLRQNVAKLFAMNTASCCSCDAPHVPLGLKDFSSFVVYIQVAIPNFVYSHEQIDKCGPTTKCQPNVYRFCVCIYYNSVPTH